MIATSVPLDKSGRSDNVSTELVILDPLHPERTKKLAVLPGTGWGSFAWSFDDTGIVAVEFQSVNASRVWALRRTRRARCSR